MEEEGRKKATGNGVETKGKKGHKGIKSVM